MLTPQVTNCLILILPYTQRLQAEVKDLRNDNERLRSRAETVAKDHTAEVERLLTVIRAGTVVEPLTVMHTHKHVGSVVATRAGVDNSQEQKSREQTFASSAASGTCVNVNMLNLMLDLNTL